MKDKTCCFTGHRKLPTEKLNKITDELEKTVIGLIADGYLFFGTGGALGFDTVAAQTVIRLKDKYPKIYKKVEQRLETGWETTIALIQQGIHEGTVRPIQIPILKTMMEATLEQFFQRDVLVQNGISYHEALDEVVSILIDGITI